MQVWLEGISRSRHNLLGIQKAKTISTHTCSEMQSWLKGISRFKTNFRHALAKINQV
jgi:hypothetical protein